MSSEKDIDLRGTYNSNTNDASTSIANTASENKTADKKNRNTDHRNETDHFSSYVGGDSQRSSSSHQFHKDSGR